MKFAILEIVLWLKDGRMRKLKFEPDKINVITGDSNTGKTAILQIIDYCLFGSKPRISESVINENVLWYGMVLAINDKKYSLARKSIDNGRVSSDYYFSSIGEIPKIPSANSSEKTIKPLFEYELGIDSNIRIPFGGKFIQAGSKISMRYFLMFNTISQDIITDSVRFFDKQDEERYREALPRIFDIAVGIDDLSNILAREERGEIEKKIRHEERRLNRYAAQKNEYHAELGSIVARAKEYGLLPSGMETGQAIGRLRDAMASRELLPSQVISTEFEGLKAKENAINIEIRNLMRLKMAIAEHKNLLLDLGDVLKPIEYLDTKKSELIRGSIFQDVINLMIEDLEAIKRDTKKVVPMETNLDEIIKEKQSELNSLKDIMRELPISEKAFNSEREKYVFIGEVKAKLELYEGDVPMAAQSSDIEDLQRSLDTIIVRSVEESKNMFLSLLEEIIKKYMDKVGGVLENYSGYHPVFDYPGKKLNLRKPLTDYIENVGSSSNHMFLHLFLFLGLHEVIARKNGAYVPSILVIDQPSRPYWGDGDQKRETLLHSDTLKIRKAFELLDDFTNRVVTQLNGHFQMIIFEHVPPSSWHNLNYFNLVEVFQDGNALIPM